MTNNIFAQIQKHIDENEVVLFMKGSASRPLCGFSATVVNILSNLEVKFKDINILEDQEMREGIKQFSDWPTIPQLYVKGEFIGGCDITKEMFESGDLAKLLAKAS